MSKYTELRQALASLVEAETRTIELRAELAQKIRSTLDGVMKSEEDTPGCGVWLWNPDAQAVFTQGMFHHFVNGGLPDDFRKLMGSYHVNPRQLFAANPGASAVLLNVVVTTENRQFIQPFHLTVSGPHRDRFAVTAAIPAGAQVGSWEIDAAAESLSTFQQIARALETSTAELMQKSPYPDLQPGNIVAH